MKKKLLLLFSATTAIGLTGIVLLATLPSGLTLACQLIESLSKNKIHFNHPNGTLIGPMQFDRITIKTPNKIITIKNIYFDWKPSRLFTKQQIHLEKITASEAKIQTKNSQTNHVRKHNHTYPFRALRYFNLQHAKIKKIIYTDGINKPIALTNIIIDLKKINVYSTLSITGSLENHQGYTFNNFSKIYPNHFNTDLNITHKKEIWAISATGNSNQLSWRTNKNRILSGVLNTQGLLSWGKNQTWKIHIDAKQLNLTQLQSSYPLISNMTIDTNGTKKSKKTNGKFNLTFNSTNSHILTTLSKHNQIWKATWSIDIKKHFLFLPGLEGNFQTDGSLNNNATQGHIKLDQTNWQNWHADSINGKWRGNLKTGDFAQLIIIAKNIKHNTLTWPMVQANLMNTQIKHPQIQLHIDNKLFPNKPTIQIDTSLSITKPQQVYKIKFQHFTAKTQAHIWHNNKPYTLIASVNSINTPNMCFTNKQASLCLKTSWHANQSLLATVTGKNFNVSNYLPTSLIQLPPLSFTATTQRTRHQPITAELTLHSTQAPNEAKSNHLPIEKLNAHLQITPKQLNISLQARTPKKGYITINVSGAHPGTDAWENQPINGKIDFNMTQPSLQFMTTNQIRIVGTRLKGKLRLNGTPSKPKLYGNYHLQAQHLFSQSTRTTLKNCELNGTSDGNILHYTFHGIIQNRPLNLTGQYNLNQEYPSLTGHLTTDNTLAYHSPQYKIFATIDANLLFKQHNLTINGNIFIPKATLKPKNFTASETLSPDIHIIHSKNVHLIQTNTSTTTHMNLSIKLGKEINVETETLTGQLTGQFKLQQKPHEFFKSNGQLGIKNAKLYLMGKKYRFTPDSNIYYLNSNLENPNLSMRIYRNVTTSSSLSSALSDQTRIKVGLNITGTLNNPVMHLYSSDLTLSPADILSYLTVNHPAGSNNQINVSQFLFLLSDVTASNLFFHKNKKNNTIPNLGFSEIGVQDTTTLDAIGTPYSENETSFVLGRYLTPNIYLRYTKGLSSDFNILQVRYAINPNWSLQSETGTLGSGLDLMYNSQSNE